MGLTSRIPPHLPVGQGPGMREIRLSTWRDDYHAASLRAISPRKELVVKGRAAASRPPQLRMVSPEFRGGRHVGGPHRRLPDVRRSSERTQGYLGSNVLDSRTVTRYRGVCLARNSSTVFFAAGWCSGSFQCSMSVAFGASAATSLDEDSGWYRSLPSNTSSGV